MNRIEKQRLSEEAKMQIKALKRIEQWRNIAFFLSAIGVVLFYAGTKGSYIFLPILGIVLVIVSTISLILLGLGLKNGRRNVKKIIHILDKGVS